jgi:hypothetical protein
MTDQTTAPPPLPQGMKKPTRYKKIRIVLFTIAVLWIGSRLLSYLSALGSPDLAVQLGDYNSLTLTNTGSQPVTIKDVVVNGRSDCKTYTAFLGGKRVTSGLAEGMVSGGVPTFVPTELKVGDQLHVSTRDCNVVRAEIETDQGSATYTFNGN